MSATSAIEWTDRTWNPVRGCSVVSPGCAHCYAMKQAHRFSGPGKAYAGLTKLTSAGPQWTGQVRLIKDALPKPLRWRTPSRVFVNSMSDLFHEDVPDEFIDQVFAVMACCPTHTFQVLTKRPGRMLKYLSYEYRWAQVEGQCDVLVGGSEAPALATPERTHLPNVWLGVSVEDQARADERIPLLLQTPAAVRFVSCEPLLDALNVRHYIGLDGANSGADFRERNGWGYDEWSGGFTGPNLHNDSCYAPEPGIHWVIVGGESGSGARRCDLRWVRDLVRDCRSAHVPVFVKQLGARPDGWWPTFPLNRHAVRDPKGGDIAEWPEDLRVREYPEMAGAIVNGWPRVTRNRLMAEHTRDQSTENAEETLPTIEEMSGLIKTFSPPPDAEHTPGPWTVRHRCVDKSPYDDESCGLGLEVDGPPEPQLRGRFARAADAHLIAAAPELLAALLQALAVIGSDEMRLVCDMADLHGMPYRGPTVDRAAMRALIAKARGEVDPMRAGT